MNIIEQIGTFQYFSFKEKGNLRDWKDYLITYFICLLHLLVLLLKEKHLHNIFNIGDVLSDYGFKTWLTHPIKKRRNIKNVTFVMFNFES